GNRQLRARPRRMAGFRVRLRHRPAGDAQIRHGRPPPLLRRRHPLAEALRIPGARRADAVGRSGGMKFSLEWLREHLETRASAEEIATRLTAIGLEVESVSNPAEALAPFRVAKVLTAEKHPQADKLQVLTVDAGTGEEIQVVCGASNARAGMLGVFGAP